MCTYLAKRGATYYFRRVIPAELRPAFGGRSEFMLSLRTKDRETAKRLIPARTVETDRAMDEAAQSLAATVPENVHQSAAEVEPSLTPGEREQAAFEAQEAAEKAERYDARADERAELRRKLATLRSVELSMPLQAMRDLLRERDDAVARTEARRADVERERLAAALPPAVQPVGSPVPLLATYDAYAAEAQIKPRTRIEWRAIIERLIAFLGHDDAARITADDLDRWKDALLAEVSNRGTTRDPVTVKGKHLGAVRATLGWAKDNRKLPANVALDVKVRLPKKQKLRERDFTRAEAEAILSAASGPSPDGASPEQVFAQRWIPWLCAYTGARVNEISQLRGEDVEEREGIWSIRITPEAGTVKANSARVVPLHPHLLEQGFPAAAKARGEGPLFYDESRRRGTAREGNTQARKVGERLASWVRSEVGITDPGLAPNHGWRHTFKTRALASNMEERIADAIQGHAPASVGRRYGTVPLETMAEAIARMPRFNRNI